MTAPSKASTVSETSLSLLLTPLTSSSDTGNSPITSYSLYWDAGTGTTSTLLFESLLTTYTVSSLTGGISYKFKVRAKNVYGYGLYSDEVTLTPANVPSTVEAIATV